MGEAPAIRGYVTCLELALLTGRRLSGRKQNGR